MNLKTKDNVINVGWENQASVKGVEDFALKMSNYVGKEVGGYYLTHKGQGGSEISEVYLGGYGGSKNSSTQNSTALRLDLVRPDLVGRVNVQVDFHTHLSQYGDDSRLVPSQRDRDHKAGQQPLGIGKFIIVTNPENVEY